MNPKTQLPHWSLRKWNLSLQMHHIIYLMLDTWNKTVTLFSHPVPRLNRFQTCTEVQTLPWTFQERGYMWERKCPQMFRARHFPELPPASTHVKISWKRPIWNIWEYSRKISRKFTATERRCRWLWTSFLQRNYRHVLPTACCTQTPQNVPKMFRLFWTLLTGTISCCVHHMRTPENPRTKKIHSSCLLCICDIVCPTLYCNLSHTLISCRYRW